MLGIGLSIEFEEFESNGDVCVVCKTEIQGKMYVMMLQVGDPMDAKPVNQLCETCYKDWSGDNTGTKSSE